VGRIVQEVNSFDNVILEICDEPFSYGGRRAPAGPWSGHRGEVVKQTEAALPQKHLLGQQIQGPIGGPVDFAWEPIPSNDVFIERRRSDSRVHPQASLHCRRRQGHVRDCIRQLQQLWQQTGGFGTLLMIAHDWDDKAKWVQSMERLARDVIPALPTTYDA
jgi:hypothetical protein